MQCNWNIIDTYILKNKSIKILKCVPIVEDKQLIWLASLRKSFKIIWEAHCNLMFNSLAQRSSGIKWVVIYSKISTFNFFNNHKPTSKSNRLPEASFSSIECMLLATSSWPAPSANTMTICLFSLSRCSTNAYSPSLPSK